ncbi:MAG: hypothetical protein WBH04_05065 [Albidovulum sp.]
MIFTKTCRAAAILIVVMSALAIAGNIYRMFGIDDEMAREIFFKKMLHKNGSPLLIGIALGTLSEISRALHSKNV